MSISIAEPESTVLLFDIPWETYEGILDALPEHHFRHTYVRGTLELFSSLIYGVSWESYEKILEAFGDHRFRHTYQMGTLEIMSPSESHEWLKRHIGSMIEAASMKWILNNRRTVTTTRKTTMEQYWEQYRAPPDSPETPGTGTARRNR